MNSEVEVERVGAVQVIRINRPRARNALNRAVADRIAAATDELDASNDLRVAVLTGAGGNFCSGMDLKAFVAGENAFVPGRGFGGITRRPPRKPLIAAVEGWAVGGGFELLLACDLVIAAETANMGVPEVKRGIVAGGGGALLLPRRLPYAVAMELLLTGDPISAPRAAEMGLVNHVVPAGRALEVAMEFAARIAQNAPLALAATKRVAREGADWPMSSAWDAQEEIVAPIRASADAREGATAFAQKRAPDWQST